MKINKLSMIFCLFLITGVSCVSYFPTPIPMRVVYHQNKRAPGHDTLVVFLPGNRSMPEDFAREEFVSIINKSYSSVDSLAVDATLGYYIKEILPERLLEDVIKPARQKGYKKIWIVGISMGGSGALWYLKKYPGSIQGVLLLAPFLADKKIIDEIDNAGGLKKWEPVVPHKNEEHQRAQMRWLKLYMNQGARLPLIALGFGDSDRFQQSDRLLADILPSKQVIVIPGGHDWETWKDIFEKFIRRGILF